MGDFNVNLLNYESHNETNDFINTMVSHYLLPHILHPTRVTDHSATVIDNIFSDNTSHKTVSGNIITQISDHFTQFIILDKIVIDYQSCSYDKNVTLQTLMNRSLLLGSLLRVWTFCMMQDVN